MRRFKFCYRTPADGVFVQASWFLCSMGFLCKAGAALGLFALCLLGNGAEPLLSNQNLALNAIYPDLRKQYFEKINLSASLTL